MPELLEGLNIGEKLKFLRLYQSKTLQEIADRSNLSKSVISKIENAKVMPSIKTLEKIAHSLGVPVSELLEPPAQ